MSETSEHAARLLSAYQAQEKRFVERRFPLSFAPEVPALRQLYSQANGLRWHPEADIAALGALDDQLDLNLYVSHLQQSKDETMRTALRLIASDRARHVAFAWAFLDHRVPALDARGRSAVIDAVHDVLANVIVAGYRNTWLLPEKSREPWLSAEEETARQGLGASSAAQERRVLRATIAQVRERFAAWKLDP